MKRAFHSERTTCICARRKHNRAKTQNQCRKANLVVFPPEDWRILYLRKTNAHGKLTRRTTRIIKHPVLMHLSLNIHIHKQRVCALIGTVSMSMKACGHRKLTTERPTRHITLTRGRVGGGSARCFAQWRSGYNRTMEIGPHSLQCTCIHTYIHAV